MLRFIEGFIGNERKNSSPFAGHDSNRLYNTHLESMPDDWYYRDKIITYAYNNFGHRSNHIEEIDLSNYILYIGCSHTMGIGNAVEDTYTYISSNLLKCDFYNMSVEGSGTDIMMHNLTTWLLHIEEKPKAIVWQWPNPLRYLTVEGSINSPNIIPQGIWKYNHKKNTDFILAGEANNFFHSKTILSAEYLKTLSFKKHIPIIEVSLTNDNSPSKIFFNLVDKARDESHFGIQSNKNLANDIVNRYLKYQ